MIIHCLSCGKAVSSHACDCPYCLSQINEMTREANGIVEREKVGERLRGMMFGLVHK